MSITHGLTSTVATLLRRQILNKLAQSVKLLTSISKWQAYGMRNMSDIPQERLS